MFDINYKTLFLLDHCLQFNESSGVVFEIDAARPPSSQHNQGFFGFFPPISKSLWTLTVENVLEYARILWDIYSEERLLRFLIHNPDDVVALNNWKEHQNIGAISELFAKVGPPSVAQGSIQHAITKAILALSEPTEEQAQLVASGKSSKVANRGRIILVTSCIQPQDVGLEEFFMNAVATHNRNASASDHLLPIHECEFVLVSVHPNRRERAATLVSIPLRDLTATIHSEVAVVVAENLYSKLVELCTAQHGLVTTTVTGIPMKEEQNALSSSNYDVTLFHPRLPTTSTETMVLRWSCPVSAKEGLGTSNPCAFACRVTPVDVISRPSTCLTNFVVSGRSVWLETPKRGKSSASSSHVLTPHGTEIWMHVMETSRNILEDPPSISEGLGGRITDYRIPDFVDFMKMNMLIPFAPQAITSNKHGRKRSIDERLAKPNEMGKDRLRRKTEYWPLTISGSLLFPMSVHIDPLLRLIPKDTLDDMEKVECDKTLWSLMSIEARGDPPPVPSPHHKKGHKRDEQWKAVYNEIERFIEANLHSPAHEKVLQCFQASRRQENGSGPKTGLEKIIDEAAKSNSSKTLTFADSPASPTSPDDAAPISLVLPSKGGKLKLEAAPSSSRQEEAKKMNLYDLWIQRTSKPDFRQLPDQLKLYPRIEKLNQEKEEAAALAAAKIAIDKFLNSNSNEKPAEKLPQQQPLLPLPPQSQMFAFADRGGGGRGVGMGGRFRFRGGGRNRFQQPGGYRRRRSNDNGNARQGQDQQQK